MKKISVVLKFKGVTGLRYSLVPPSLILHDKYDVGIGFLFKILAEKGKMLLHIASLAINPNASKDSRIT